MTKQEMAFTLAAAREKIDAFRVDASVSATHTWAYYSVDTRSFWLVTSGALAKLADMDTTEWEETDDTAIEYGDREPMRAR